MSHIPPPRKRRVIHRFGPAHRRSLAALTTLALLLCACGDDGDAPEAQDRSEEEREDEQQPPEPRTVTVLGAGDLLIHSTVWQQAEAHGDGTFDFAPMMDGLAPTIGEADLALCHLEVPLGEPEGPFSGYPMFQAPPQLTDALVEWGYDGCSTASNHTLDQGTDGIVRTLDALEDADLGAAGSARDEQEAAETQIYEVATDDGDPVSVAQLSYTYGFNGMTLPEGQEWMGNLIDAETILADAQTATEAGADLVTVAMHWGEEYVHDATQEQRDLAAELLASEDIDVIFGHHAHVVQPVDEFDGDWVIYGMGNQLSGQHVVGTPQREGAMAQVTFVEDAQGQWSTDAVEIVPTWLATDPLRVVHLADELADPDLPDAQREEFQGAYDRITGHIDGLGALDHGAEVTPVD
ncbi:CapA family protein [Spiractinospora alimapuensis]|uniref:CapA family protein n=1 Tax=Spiractinospora alimapuensis TaxID=2820884 RepID=UPI001F19BB7E|nr:CapA family protein [Spiractinospora alimapuensis]QVQ52620.1 CapA family protein [Spiractinospora alimapuensis]